MWRTCWLLVLAAVPTGAACGSDDEGCLSDDECGFELVCDREAGACVQPPGDCVGYCVKSSTCGGEARDACIKSTCGASFLQYYRNTYGEDCEQAWLDLMECNGNLSCEDWTTYQDQVDPETGTAPFCQTELQAKNSDC